MDKTQGLKMLFLQVELLYKPVHFKDDHYSVIYKVLINVLHLWEWRSHFNDYGTEEQYSWNHFWWTADEQ